MKEDVRNLTNDELEERGLVECCGHCGSFGGVKRLDDGKTFCEECTAYDFRTEIITLEEWIERDKRNSDVPC